MKAKQRNLPRSEIDKGVNIILDCMSQALEEGRRIQITGFGTFLTKYIDSRAGRNPNTGDAIFIPKKRRVRFRPSKKMQESVTF
jgi:nucleoid DNA-binding protein|tara:strand:- start:9 stop:260 length:252 start_codon:yes stop_codon:yes gene_type:complete